MTDEFSEIRERRERFIRAVYELRDRTTGIAISRQIKERMGLEPDELSDSDALYMDIAQYFEGLGYIERQASGYSMVAITSKGMQYVEGDLQRQEPRGDITFNVGNAYNSIFGAHQHAEMNNVSFDFSVVEAELDRAEREAEQRGGPDAAELRELIAEVRAIHRSDEPLQPGRLSRYLEVVQRNGWIAAPLAGTALSHLF
jgi:hypothetical protein